MHRLNELTLNSYHFDANGSALQFPWKRSKLDLGI